MFNLSGVAKDKIKDIVLKKINGHIPQYWTCFTYARYTPDALHCTHKMLGEQSPANIKKIIDLLEDYFSNNPFKSFTPYFSSTSFFGKNKEVKVLKVDEVDKNLFLIDLKNKLDLFKEDTYPEYSPHVTTVKDYVYLPLTNYCFMFGDKILRKY